MPKTRTESILRVRSDPAREVAPPAVSPAPSDEPLAYLGSILQEERNLEAKLDKTAQAKADLAPVVAQAKRIIADLEDLEKTHGDEMRRLSHFNWYGLRPRFTNESSPLLYQANTIADGLQNSIPLALRYLRQVEIKVNLLSEWDLKNLVPGELRRDVPGFADLARNLKDRLGVLRRLAAEVADVVRRAPPESRAVPIPRLPTARDRQEFADMEFDPFKT